MPFNIQTKTEMFIRCGRLCCLCLKQCGTNIEAAHIIDEAQGGLSDADNGIPVCLDCHQEIGAYDPKHPKGNKFQSRELIARRNRVYELVESGVLYAQLIAQRSHSNISNGNDSRVEMPVRPAMSLTAKRFLGSIQSSLDTSEISTRKLSLLSQNDRAYILEELSNKIVDNLQDINLFTRLLQSDDFPKNEATLLLEKVLREATLYGSVMIKAAILREFSSDLIASVYEGVLLAFFEDIIVTIKRDQYPEVNAIVPSLMRHSSIVPRLLWREYVLSLIDQAKSGSYQGAPAARKILLELPAEIAKEGIQNIDNKYLFFNYQYDFLKQFIDKYIDCALKTQKKMFIDYVRMTAKEFYDKYFPDEWEIQ